MITPPIENQATGEARNNKKVSGGRRHIRSSLTGTFNSHYYIIFSLIQEFGLDKLV